MLNNHLDSEYKQEQASMLYVILQTASEKLHVATNIPDESFDEEFRFYINYFVMITEDYGLQKVKVIDTRHYTESERFNIKLQVANYWLVEMRSLNYEEVFFVEFYVNFRNST